MNGKKNLYILAAMLFVALLTTPVASADNHTVDSSNTADNAADNEFTEKASIAESKGLIAVGAALAVGLAGIGTGIAQSNIGSAAIGAVAEAIHLCKKNGVDPNKFIKAIEGGLADSKILKNHGKKMIEGNYTPGGKTSTHLKDMNNILESAKNVNLNLPISGLIKNMYKDLVKNGHSNKDHSSLYLKFEDINN